MTEQDQRIAITEACGFKGCSDSNCDYRKCQHLHKDGQVYFPETYSRPMYPDYLHDLNAMREAEGHLEPNLRRTFAMILYRIVLDLCDWNLTWDNWFRVSQATASERAEAFLRTIGKWVES